MYSYDGLFTLLKAKNMKRSELAAALGISSRTLAKIGRGERLADGEIPACVTFFACENSAVCKRFVIPLCYNESTELLNIKYKTLNL